MKFIKKLPGEASDYTWSCVWQRLGAWLDKSLQGLGASLALLVMLWPLKIQAQALPHVPGQILVKPSADLSERGWQSLLVAHGARQRGAIKQINVRILQVPEEKQGKVLSALQNNPNITFAEPNYMFPPAFVPNDTYYYLQWHLPKISAPAAWDITTGDGVTVAIIDTGVDSAHPDLVGRLVPGWNFYDDNPDTSDVNGHGTVVAGVACAAGNNGVGMASPAWRCNIMPIRVADANGYTDTTKIASGIIYAADHGAKVANASFAVVSVISSLSSAAQYLMSKGGVFTIAAGNGGLFDQSPDDPAIFRISATDENDVVASFSNTGNSIDMSAPGVNIATTVREGRYGYSSGTSVSAPLVAGVAALMLSANPALTGTQVQDLLKQTADDLGDPGWDPIYGWGRVNAFRAVQAAAGASPMVDTTPPTVSLNSPVSGSVVSGPIAVDVTAADDVAVTRLELYLDGTLAGSGPGPSAAFSWNSSAVANGAHTLQARAYDAAGNVGSSATSTITVQNADTVAPTVSISSLSSGATVSGTINVSVSTTDNVAIAKVECYLDGVLIGTSSLATPVFAWNTTTVPNGTHILQAKAYDAAGNSALSASVVVNVQNSVADTTSPIAKITSPSTNTKITQKSTKVTASATDDYKVTRMELLIDGKLIATATTASLSYNWSTSKLTSGAHTLQAVAYDAAGNCGRSLVVTVTK